MEALHHQAKQTLLEETLEQFTAPLSWLSFLSSNSSALPSSSLTDGKVSLNKFSQWQRPTEKLHEIRQRQSGQVMFEEYDCKINNKSTAIYRLGLASRRAISKACFCQAFEDMLCKREEAEEPLFHKGRLISGDCGAYGCWVLEAEEGWDLT